jgi:hypothetical protein
VLLGGLALAFAGMGEAGAPPPASAVDGGPAVRVSRQLTEAQQQAFKARYRELGSEAIESRPAAELPEGDLVPIDVSERMRSASFGAPKKLWVVMPAEGEPREFYVERGRATNRPRAVFGPFTLP